MRKMGKTVCEREQCRRRGVGEEARHMTAWRLETSRGERQRDSQQECGDQERWHYEIAHELCRCQENSEFSRQWVEKMGGIKDAKMMKALKGSVGNDDS